MGVGDEKWWVPLTTRDCPEVETELQLGDPPVALNGRPGVAFHRQPLVIQGPDGEVFDHSRLVLDE